MIELSNTLNEHASNAWGRTIPTRTKVLQIEAEDAGIRPHYRGYCHSSHRVNKGDIINVYEYDGWTCWNFATQEKSHDQNG